MQCIFHALNDAKPGWILKSLLTFTLASIIQRSLSHAVFSGTDSFGDDRRLRW